MLSEIPGVPTLPETVAFSPAILRKIDHGSWTECQATFPGHASTGARRFKLDAVLNGNQSACLGIHAFEDKERFASVYRKLKAGKFAVPHTALLQDSDVAGGTQIAMISGIDSTPLYDEDGWILGRFFEDADAKYCALGDIRPANSEASRGAQTGEVLERIQRTLTAAGMDFGDVVRTWFYNDGILDWYDEFNRARTSFFQRQRIGRIPASTGIGASNACGAALVARVVAVRPKTRAVTIRRVDSPLQQEASTYGSVFSRAMEVADRVGRTLYISGTASILPNGETAHPGDAARQIETTLDIVEALLAKNGMGFSDATRAIAYFRHREDMPLWEVQCRERKLPPLPILLTQCDICRDDLLFEIELDAVRRDGCPS